MIDYIYYYRANAIELWRSSYRLEYAVVARRSIRAPGGLRPARRPQNLYALVEPL